jgi:hypothetical protein
MDMVALRKVREEKPPKAAMKPKKPRSKVADPVQVSLFDHECEEPVSDNGQLHSRPIVSAAIPTVEEQGNRVDEQRRVEDSITKEVQESLSERATRFLQVRGMAIVPDGPFAAPSAECAKQFRDGHYYGCIALTQAVMEAIVRLVWRVKLCKKKSQEGDFEKNLEALHKKGFVTDEWATRLEIMWSDRHTFHHLRQSVESERRKLEETARNNLNLLNELEKQFFGYRVMDGIVVPNHPEYWSLEEEVAAVFVRDRT